MIGILLVFLAESFGEVGTSIGKAKAMARKEGLYTMGFLNMFWALIFFILFAVFVRGEFAFDMASLPTVSIRFVLEILIAHVTIRALVFADRSTFGFLRIWTIPLLLLVDTFLGYTLSSRSLFGILLIVASFIVLFVNHGIRKRGAGYVLASAVLAVATISLYKYDITNFNSVEAEQSIMLVGILLYFLFAAYFFKHRKPWEYLKEPVYFFQSFIQGVSSLLLSFAYLYSTATIITTAKRAFAILASIVSGNAYFQEKKLSVKLLSFALIVGGLFLVATG